MAILFLGFLELTEILTEIEERLSPQAQEPGQKENDMKVMKVKDLMSVMMCRVQLIRYGESAENVNIGRRCYLYEMPAELLELEVMYIYGSCGRKSTIGTIEIMVYGEGQSNFGGKGQKKR